MARRHERLFDQPVEISQMNYTDPTQEEQYQIYALKKAERNQREIANVLDRSESTISRELTRNSRQRGYRQKQAHSMAIERHAVNSLRIDEATGQFAQHSKYLQVIITNVSKFILTHEHPYEAGFT